MKDPLFFLMLVLLQLLSPRFVTACNCPPDCRCSYLDPCPGGICTGCFASNWGPACQYKCAPGCETGFVNGNCDRNNGKCVRCITSNWGPDDCQYKCAPGCETGFVKGNCDRNNGKCVRCITSNWGPECQYKCAPGCATGFVNGNCDRNNGQCVKCMTSQWGKYCDEPCNEGCATGFVNGNCNRETGKCIRCKSGYSGPFCTRSPCYHCLPGRNCQSCISCESGFWGEQCNNTCTHCSKCDWKDGTCLVECDDMWWGPSCSSPCPRTCPWNSCDRYSGSCPSCFVGFYGRNCQYKCSDNCISGTCDPYTGYCMCKPNTVGDFCLNRCQDVNECETEIVNEKGCALDCVPCFMDRKATECVQCAACLAKVSYKCCQCYFPKICG